MSMTVTTPDPRRILILNSARKWIGEAAHSVAMAEALRTRGHHAILGLRAGFEKVVFVIREDFAEH